MGDKRKAAFFDVDGVVYASIIGVDFMEYLEGKHLLDRSTMDELSKVIKVYDAGKLDSKQFYQESMQLWSKGIAEKEKLAIEAEAALFTQTILGKISSKAIRVMEKDKIEGYMVILVTGSPAELAQSLSALLGADYSIGSEVEECNGKYTGRLITPFPVDAGKAEWVRRTAKIFKISLPDSKAYGNSELDIPMLEAVGIRFAINPDRRLRFMAKRNSWKIEHWTT